MPDLFATIPPGPMRPWDYLRLRREAAGRTIAQAAAPHSKRPGTQPDVEQNLRAIEMPHHVLRADYLIEALQRSYRFEPDVYVALRDLPPDQHPTVCRGCGGTPWDLPTNRDGTEATIGDTLVCTACEEKRDGARGAAMRRAA